LLSKDSHRDSGFSIGFVDGGLNGLVLNDLEGKMKAALNASSELRGDHHDEELQPVCLNGLSRASPTFNSLRRSSMRLESIDDASDKQDST